MTKLNHVPARGLQALKATEVIAGGGVLAGVLDATGGGTEVLSSTIVIASVALFVVSRGALTLSAYIIYTETTEVEDESSNPKEEIKIVSTWVIIIVSCVLWLMFAMGDGYKNIALISTALVFLLYQLTSYEIYTPVEDGRRIELSS